MNTIDSESSEKCQVSPIRLVPGEWDEKTLLDAVGMKKDLIVAGPFGSNLKVSDYRDEGIPIIRLQNIDYGKFIDKEIKYISPEKARELAYHSFRAGDLVLAKLGDPIGKTCKVPDYFKDGIVVADVVRIRVENGWADTKFIMYSLNSVAAKKQLINGKIGSTRPRVNLDQIRGIRILVPPLNQQRKIAVIISSVDAAIEQTDAIIAKTELVKKGLMRELFTRGVLDKELKVQKIRYSPLIWSMPEDWEVKELSDLAYQIVDGTHLTPNYIENGIPFLRVTDIKNKNIDWAHVKHISLDEHKILSRRCKPEEGDLLLSKNGTIGIPYLICFNKEFSIFVSLCLLKINQEAVDITYLYHVLKSDIVFNQYKLRSKTGTVTNLHLEEIRTLQIPIPQKREQRKIVAILSTVDKKIEAEKEYRENLEKFKQGLMQDLLIGRVPVKVEGHD